MPVTTRHMAVDQAVDAAPESHAADSHHVHTVPDIPRIPLLGVVPGCEAFDAPIDRRSDFYRLQALSHVHEHPLPHQPQPLLVRTQTVQPAVPWTTFHPLPLPMDVQGSPRISWGSHAYLWFTTSAYSNHQLFDCSNS